VVGISLLTLVPGVVGGSETYARELVRALARVGELGYRVYVPTIARDAADGLPARPIMRYRASRALPGRALAMSLAGVRPGPIRREMQLTELGAIHFPLSVMLPVIEEVPAATTILDLQHEFLPGNFSRAELAYRRLVYRRGAERSRIVITISEHARRTLIERMGLEAERVRAIHFGVDHERFRPDGAPREAFLLYPANRWPHKNHERLFEALALLRRERPELRLVLTGAGHEGKPLPEGAESRGRVSADDLVRLYRTASALVFPSLYEGFGQPPLEAMACGCPVAVSNAGPLPEVCGEAARYFDPTSAEEIAAAVEDVLASPHELVRKGLQRAAAFTWDECARQHETVYRELKRGPASPASG
jgi:glycosyltransferase involved in cell wall biosynthesis